MKQPKIKVVSRPSKLDDGEVYLMYRYQCLGRTHFFTGVKIPAVFFKKGSLTEPIKKKCPDFAHHSQQLTKVYRRIYEISTRLFFEGVSPTAALVRQRYDDYDKVIGVDSADRTLNSFFDDYLKSKDDPLGAESLRAYKTLFEQFTEFFGEIKESEFAEKQWRAFVDWQINKGMSANTIVFRLTKLRSFIKFVQQRGTGKLQIQDFYSPKEVKKKIMLDLPSLQKLREYQPKTQAMQRVKDMVLIQCFTALRISDVKRLNSSNIEPNEGEWFISMKSYKTRKDMYIPLSDEAYEILKKYNFELPKLAEQYYNRQIKQLIKDAEIMKKVSWIWDDFDGRPQTVEKFLHEVITNHCCSRTAITYLFDQGYRPHMVADITGKTLETIMQYYYGRTTKEEIRYKTKAIKRSRTMANAD